MSTIFIHTAKFRTANLSRTALPAYGHTLGMCVAPISGRTQDAFPGNPAWRPPIC